MGAALRAAAAIVFNAYLFPRLGGRRLWREEEGRRGQALGILLYPVAVLLLILLFWRRLEVAAATWGILAFGDGMASIVGMTLGARKLPWNPRKSWAGSLAYWLFGGAGGGGPPAVDGARAVRAGLRAGRWRRRRPLFAALLESLPIGLDDNLGVPIVTGVLPARAGARPGALGGAGGRPGAPAPAGDRRRRQRRARPPRLRWRAASAVSGALAGFVLAAR